MQPLTNSSSVLASNVITSGGANVDSVLTDLVIIRSFSLSSPFPVVPANSYADISIPSYSIPSGYYPIGIIQVSGGNQGLSLEAFGADGTSCTLRIRNNTSSDMSSGASMRIAFMKSAYINRS